MRELSAKGKPPPYFIAYEVHDRNETTVMASYGALVQSTSRRSRRLQGRRRTPTPFPDRSSVTSVATSRASVKTSHRRGSITASCAAWPTFSFSDRQRAERTIAAHLAVAEALSEWRSKQLLKAYGIKTSADELCTSAVAGMSRGDATADDVAVLVVRRTRPNAGV